MAISDKTSLGFLLEAQEQLSADAGRVRKPRSEGITMVLVFDLANYGPDFIAPYSDLVDKVKILDTLWHNDVTIFSRSVEAYREMDITVACGGTQFEIALAQGSVERYADGLKRLGINEVEVEHHADVASLDQLKREVDFFKTRGFSVIGEVGKKWWWRDATRVTRDSIDVEATSDAISAFLEAGADWVYWEGAIVGGLIGRQLENQEGQKQLLEVTGSVDMSRVILEVYDRRNQPIYPMIAWLVNQFGPNVNLANIDPWMVKRVEWLRHGIMFEMDHPYMRWKAQSSGPDRWWQTTDLPDYSIDVQRPYALG